MDLKATDRESVLDELIEQLDLAGRFKDRDVFKQAIVERESQGVTGIGEGIAIPHAKSDAVKAPTICFGRSVKGIDYPSLD